MLPGWPLLFLCRGFHQGSFDRGHKRGMQFVMLFLWQLLGRYLLGVEVHNCVNCGGKRPMSLSFVWGAQFAIV